MIKKPLSNTFVSWQGHQVEIELRFLLLRLILKYLVLSVNSNK